MAAALVHRTKPTESNAADAEDDPRDGDADDAAMGRMVQENLRDLANVVRRRCGKHSEPALEKKEQAVADAKTQPKDQANDPTDVKADSDGSDSVAGVLNDALPDNVRFATTSLNIVARTWRYIERSARNIKGARAASLVKIIEDAKDINIRAYGFISKLSAACDEGQDELKLIKDGLALLQSKAATDTDRQVARENFETAKLELKISGEELGVLFHDVQTLHGLLLDEFKAIAVNKESVKTQKFWMWVVFGIAASGLAFCLMHWLFPASAAAQTAAAAYTQAVESGALLRTLWRGACNICSSLTRTVLSALHTIGEALGWKHRIVCAIGAAAAPAGITFLDTQLESLAALAKAFAAAEGPISKVKGQVACVRHGTTNLAEGFKYVNANKLKALNSAATAYLVRRKVDLLTTGIGEVKSSLTGFRSAVEANEKACAALTVAKTKLLENI